ncbi:MAG: zinc-binding dehydrogenase [Actinomycetota bacterium]|nr:zinc-binding dehydrogenase [Actinomycetota bacterium]
MRALTVERSVPRFAAARLASAWQAGAGGRIGPLRLSDIDPPEAPPGDWQRIRPRLAGICGSDLSTVDGRSSRWFEPLVTFPFVPGHEIVADADDGRRVVIQPVLACATRGLRPLCSECAGGWTNRCHCLRGGHLHPGLQTGFCADVGGGWSTSLVAHDSQIHAVPDGMSDEAAVMIEPTACGVHAALAGPAVDDQMAVVIGAGTLGLVTVAALTRFRPDVSTIIVVAKHPRQRQLASELGATAVVEPGELRRAVRRRSGTWMADDGQLAGGAPLTYDCVGSAASIADAMAVTAPGGTVVLAGMPGRVSVDLTALWQREISLMGAYTYGPEAKADGRHSFELALDLVTAAGLGRLVTAAYSLDRHPEAIAHASSAGRRGATKVVFDLRAEKRR